MFTIVKSTSNFTARNPKLNPYSFILTEKDHTTQKIVV